MNFPTEKIKKHSASFILFVCGFQVHFMTLFVACYDDGVVPVILSQNPIQITELDRTSVIFLAPGCPVKGTQPKLKTTPAFDDAT